MIRSDSYDYNDGYVHVKGITVPNTTAADAPVNNINTKVIFKNCVPFII